MILDKIVARELSTATSANTAVAQRARPAQRVGQVFGIDCFW
jgi:hypothetical protein